MSRRPAWLALLAGGLALGPAAAGPTEARRSWERAQALKGAPWRERAGAYRDVVLEANAGDRLRARALLALAGLLRDVGHVHGASAAEAWAARQTPQGEDLRARAHLDLAQGLREEGDGEAAEEALRAAATEGRASDVRIADRALDLLSEDAADREDARALDRVREWARRDEAAAHVRIRIAGRAGLLALAGGDRAAALRLLAEAEGLAREASRSDGAESVLATKAWLDLPLRARLGP